MTTPRTLLVLTPALLAATLAAQLPGGRAPAASSSSAVPGLGDAHATPVPTYRVIQMGRLGQEHAATAFDLDPSFDPRFPTSRPVIVGGSFPDSLPISVVRAVGYFTDGFTLDLGVPLSTAFGMNAHGTIVGYTGDNGFRYARGSWTILPGLTRISHAYAWAVNSHDIVVGSEGGWSRSKALYWTPDDQVHELRTGAATSSALADINDRDVVAGHLRYPWSTDLAFTMKVDGIRPRLLPPPFPGVPCYAAAINDAGDVVGQFPGLFGAYQPVLWSHGLAIPLPVLPNEGGARAYDINNHGVIVGSSNHGQAVVWIDGAIYDLNVLTPDFEPFLANARAINDWGVIACEADGRATLLIPN